MPSAPSLHSAAHRKKQEVSPRKIEHLPSESPNSRACLNKHEFRRAAKPFPHLSKLPHQEPRKDGMHIDARIVIREALRLRLAVIAMHRMVETFAHVVREREWAEAANAVGK